MTTRSLIMALVLALIIPASAQTAPAPIDPATLRFTSYDRNPKNFDKVTVALNTMKRNGRTFFLEVGQSIPSSTLLVKSFEQKTATRADGIQEDASEITLEDTATKKTTVIKIYRPPLITPSAPK
jgi:hypothetical protein